MLGLFVKNHALSVNAYCDVSVVYISNKTQQHKCIEITENTENNILTVSASIRARGSGMLQHVLMACRWLIALQQCWHIICRNRGKPNLTHVHVLTRQGLLALWLKIVYRIPYIVSEHWSRYFPENHQYKGWFRRLTTKFVLRHSEALLCVSGCLLRAMQKNGLRHAKSHIIFNVVDTDLFRPLPNKPIHDYIDLVHISCFDEKSKNISGLLQAIKMLCLTTKNIRLSLIGDGRDKSMLEEVATKLGFDDGTVIFHGLLTPGEVANRLQKADFLIQTSYYETFGTVVAESMACGVPVISTGVGIYPEIYTPSFGVLIPSTNAADIADSIQRAIMSKEAFNPEALRHFAVLKFSTQSIGQQLSEIYTAHSIKKASS